MRKLWFREIIWKKLKCVLVIQSCTTLWDPMTVACHFLCPWDSPSNNTGMGSHSLLQGIFLIQELKPYLLYCRWILYHLSQQGMHACMLSCFGHVWLFVTPWTIAQEAPLSKQFSRQENPGVGCISLSRDLPNPGTEPTCAASPLCHQGSPAWK